MRPDGRRRRATIRRFVPQRLEGVPEPQPVHPMGRTIASSFWGKAWCEHLEKFSDYENRLPRGRTYLRNGSVWHLDVLAGRIEARVRGTDLYRVVINVDPLAPSVWKAVKERSRGQIGSILELLQGRLSVRVMAVVCDRDKGIFPAPREIHLSCSCPDWAVMCKHVAAVLYGVGHRLDERPELLFTLRDVDASELIAAQVAVPTDGAVVEGTLGDESLEEIFGIELSDASEAEAPSGPGSGPPFERRPKGRSRSKRRQRDGVSRRTDGKTARANAGPTQPLTGAAVKRVRREDGLSVPEFAWALGVSEATVRRWEETQGSLRLRAQTRTALAAWMEERPGGDV